MNNSDRKIQNRLFDVAWILFLVSQMATITAWYALCNSEIKVIVYKGVALFSCGICLAIVIINLIKKIYPLKTLICYAVLGIVFALSWYFGRDFQLVWVFLLLLAAYELDAKRIVVISLIIIAVTTIVVVLCSQIGLADDTIFMETTRERHGLGFVWTTNAPALLFFFSVLYICLRKSVMKIWEYVILELVNVYFYLETETRMPFFVLTIIFIFFAVEGLFKNHWKFCKKLNWLYYAMPVLVCVVTMLVYFSLDRYSAIFARLNNILNSRLWFGIIAEDIYGVTLFGQPIIWNGGSVTTTDWANYFYVDCSYIKIMLELGVVTLAAVLAIYTRLIYRACKIKDYWLVLVVVMVLIYGFTEPRLFDMTFNMVPLLAFVKLDGEPLVYKKGFLREIFPESEEKQVKSTVE